MSRIPYTNKVGETLGSIADSAAAYSLRALNGGDPMVARVRRSSDDAEKDFTASDMDSGSVADWVNGKQDTTLPCDVASAAAAYSLRSVNSNYTGSVIRVRRSSDDAEKDFTASDVSAGALVDWVNEDVVTTLDAEDNNTSGWLDLDSQGSTSLVSIDSSSPIAGSYSYKFANTTTGTSSTYPRFRRQSLPFNFTAGNTYRIKCKIKLISGSASLRARIGSLSVTGTEFLNYTSLTLNNVLEVDGTITPTSIGGIQNAIEFLFDGREGAFEVLCDDIEITQLTSNGHVTTWYDQSGNGNNATQSTASSQPKIVDAGVYLGELNFLSSTTTLSFSDIACGTTYSFFCALPRLDVSNFKIISDGGAAPRIDFERGAPDLIEVVDNNFGNKKFQTTNLFLDSNSLTSIINASTTFNVFHNGNASVTNPFTIPNHSTFNTLGGQAAGGVYEVILYNTDQSSNRFKIESNINNHYGLYTNANDGFVTSWYDQSGNDNHATQSTAGSQPKIVDGGVLVSDGIDFDGANYLFRDSFTQGNLEQPNTILSVAKMDSNDDQNRKVYDGNPFTGRNMLFLSPEGSGQFGIYSGDTLLTGDTATSDKHLFTALYNSTSSEFFIDGTLEVSGDSGVYSMDAIVIGANHDKASNHWLGKIQEVIIYNSDQSSNRAAIETNINNYYDIY